MAIGAGPPAVSVPLPKFAVQPFPSARPMSGPDAGQNTAPETLNPIRSSTSSAEHLVEEMIQAGEDLHVLHQAGLISPPAAISNASIVPGINPFIAINGGW